MELMYPIALIICFVLSIALFFIKFNKKSNYTNGKKVANTQYIKETEYYKAKMKKYLILSNAVKILSIICIVLTGVLISRPITTTTKSEEKLNRDILMGLDISTSQSEVNLELIKKFKEILPEIKGDRIGIVLYNTAPMVYCPLTDDYDYINECFEKIEEQLNIAIQYNGNPPVTYEENGKSIPTLWYGGVGKDAETRGSSLIGDGLAGTLFSFPNLKTDKQRTRIIIFATDNVLAGTETVSLEDACDLCKQYNVNIYAYCPTVQMNIYTSEEKIASYKKAIEQNAGGKFYTGNLSQMSTNIVNEIKETKTSLLKTSKKTYVTDHPEKIVIIILIIFVILIIIEKMIKI